MSSEIPFTFLGLLVLTLMLLSRWIWDYNRSRREEAEQHEPKAVPALHLTYATKTEHTALAAKLDEELGRERAARKKIHEEIAVLQADTRALAVETKNQSATLAELKQDGRDTRARIDDLPRRTAEAMKTLAKS